MTTIIRIPLHVENMNALAGYYTEGPSIMACYGLVSQLESDVMFEVSRFGLVIEHYESRTSELLTTGLDLLPRNKQRDAVRPATGYRYANMQAALYVETEDDIESEQVYELLKDIERSINKLRFQGGNIVEYISADDKAPVHLSATQLKYTQERIAFIVANEKPLSMAYLSMHLPEPLKGDELIEAYAEALSSKDTFMVCHGYVLVGNVNDAAGNTQNLGEPSYTLAQAKSVHALKKLPDTEQDAVLQRFFWAFDHQQHRNNPATFFIN